MTYSYEAKLRHKAEALIHVLHAKNMLAELVEDSFREYHVKIAVSGGKVLLYYKPSKNTFSLRYHELKNKKVVPQLEAIWEQVMGTSNPGAPQASAKTTRDLLEIAKTAYQAFVDGSFDRGKVGYGAVILCQGEEAGRLYGRVHKFIESRQIGGELAATMRVLDWCTTQDIPEIDIFYDYNGIEKWAQGIWQAQSPVGQAYVAYMQKNHIQVYWHKVKSHTGNYWNEVADKLAKRGTSS